MAAIGRAVRHEEIQLSSLIVCVSTSPRRGLPDSGYETTVFSFLVRDGSYDLTPMLSLTERE